MIWIYLILGLAGGIIGGMGMGGGTLVIPLLTIFCATEQHIAQSVNLIAFIPMAIVAIIIHAKNKLIKGEYFFWMALPATAMGVGASFLAKQLEGAALSKYFGFFLIALGIYQLVSAIVSAVRSRRNKEEKQ